MHPLKGAKCGVSTSDEQKTRSVLDIFVDLLRKKYLL